MNESAGDKSHKVKIMYVREQQASKRGNKKPPHKSSRHQHKSTNQSTHKTEPADAFSPWKRSSVPQEHHPTDSALLRQQRVEEVRIYGEYACQNLFKQRPEAIIKAWFIETATPRFRDTLRWLAAHRKAYQVVDVAELQKITTTEHHGGVCFLVKKRQPLNLTDYLMQTRPQRNCLLALDNVRNPHNLGAIMRSCAHFGVDGIVLQEPTLLESGAAFRTAEGGAEYLTVLQTEQLGQGLEQLRQAGYQIVTTSSHQGKKLSTLSLPDKMVLVLGEESHGLADTIWTQGDLKLRVEGTGNVESLNVSVATGIILAQWWGQKSRKPYGAKRG